MPPTEAEFRDALAISFALTLILASLFRRIRWRREGRS
jgi:hypothetical protein